MNDASGALPERKRTLAENRTMQFVLRGFNQVVGLRVFAFEGIAADRTRTLFTVSADVALTRRYGIRLQDLPLLCRAVLERCHEGAGTRAFAYTEEQMRLHADDAAAREVAVKRRKPPRRPAADHGGAAWQVPPR
jgi:hypothetical protein